MAARKMGLCALIAKPPARLTPLAQSSTRRINDRKRGRLEHDALQHFQEPTRISCHEKAQTFLPCLALGPLPRPPRPPA